MSERCVEFSVLAGLTERADSGCSLRVKILAAEEPIGEIALRF